MPKCIFIAVDISIAGFDQGEDHDKTLENVL